MPRYYAEVEKTMFELAKAFDEETSMQKNIKIISLMQTLGHKALNIIKRNATADVQEVKHGKWIIRHRHEHYPSGKPYDENVCPFCKRTDHNGDGSFCGYCGAKMDGE